MTHFTRLLPDSALVSPPALDSQAGRLAGGLTAERDLPLSAQRQGSMSKGESSMSNAKKNFSTFDFFIFPKIHFHPQIRVLLLIFGKMIEPTKARPIAEKTD